MENKLYPLVTVLMSTYNNEKTVGRAIDSILNQTFTDYEFLIINDASKDRTEQVIKGFSDSHIRIINNKKNLGLTRSLNKGLKEAKGKYLARIDADDISLPKRLEKQVNFLQNNPDFILIGTSFNIINKKGKIIKKVEFNLNPEELYYDLIFQNMFAHSSVLFKLEDVIKLGEYSERLKYAQDYDLWCKLSKKGKIWVLPDILTKWCDDPSNISNQKRRKQQKIGKDIFINNLKSLKVNQNVIDNANYLHNFYDDEFIDCPKEKIKSTFDALLGINDKIINNSPSFYNKRDLKKVSYKNVIDLLTRIYKNTKYKKKVLSFLFRNFFNIALDIAVLKKILNAIKAR